MKLNRKIYTTNLQGEPLSLEVSELAGQANAAVLGTLGETSVLATVVMGKEDRNGDFFPLTVEYEERFYAAGKIIGSRFIRREGRPSDEAVLSGRLIDRTIRPLFDSRLRKDVQVTITVLSYDEKNDPDVIALLAVSSALSISDIPWNGPVAGARFVSPLGEKPSYLAFFSGPENRVNMIELEGEEVQESPLHTLYDEAQKVINSLIDFQKKIVKEIGKQKVQIVFEDAPDAFSKIVFDFLRKGIEEALLNKKTDELLSSLFVYLKDKEGSEDHLRFVPYLFESFIDGYVHEMALKNKKRADGRALDQVRDLYAETQLFKRTHGSGLFIRGTTQVIALTTLAAPNAEQIVETMETTGKKRFLLHYNFPSFSVGEAGRSRGPGRREIGHGALAAKAIKSLIPAKEDFPYTIRIVAETLSSNGSSSMASTCAASLSLMDAGVPMKKHVAGISIGLALDEKSGAFEILTDIQGPEDHYCDMDFKVAGTRDGITAIQMDVKVQGITKEIFEQALLRAGKARATILDTMEATIATPRAELSPYAPKIFTLVIDPQKIGLVIGSGGKTINNIIALTNNEVTIDIDDSGLIFFAGTNLVQVQKAREIVEQLVREYKVGDIVEGNIVKILDFGAIMDLGGGQDGMIHVSELKEGYVKKVEDVIKMGDFVRAKVIKADPDGRIGLSLKGLQ